MPKTLTIGSEDFEFPVMGDNADWGESVSDWAQAVTDAVANVLQPNDVLTTSAAIANNQVSAASIPGFFFDTAEVRSILADFLITRTTVSPANNFVESGVIEGCFNGSDWSLSIRRVGDDSGVTISITSAGQVQYTSTNVTGTSYAGTIVFRARVINDL